MDEGYELFKQTVFRVAQGVGDDTTGSERMVAAAAYEALVDRGNDVDAVWADIILPALPFVGRRFVQLKGEA